MLNRPLNVLAVAGSLNQKSVTRIVIAQLARELERDGCAVELIDLQKEALDFFNPDSSYNSVIFSRIQPLVIKADVILVGTPDYHGSMSGALKNFLDHFWQEFAGKLFGSVVASHEKGLTVTDQIRTVARQCYAWSMPYGISFTDKEDVKDEVIVSEAFRKRLDMFVRDLRVYGSILGAQREGDLKGTDPTFMARLRGKV